MKNLIVAAVMVFSSLAVADNAGMQGDELSQAQIQQAAQIVSAANGGQSGDEPTAEEYNCVERAWKRMRKDVKK